MNAWFCTEFAQHVVAENAWLHHSEMEIRDAVVEDVLEIMPGWRFCTFDLSTVHAANRHISRSVRVFKEFAAQMTRTLFHRSRPRSRTGKWPARERAAEVGSGA